MDPLIDRLKQPDVADLPDWGAADVLNSPDESLPVVVEWHETQIGLGEIMAALGAEPGAAFLSAIEGAAVTNNVMKWGLEILRGSKLDLASIEARETIEQLVQSGMLEPSQRDKLFALSRHERHPSWAEANDMAGKIDARAVGLARGAKP